MKRKDGRPKRSTRYRFWDYLLDAIPAGDQCWPWPGQVMPNGYPKIGQIPAYREVWEIFMSPIPDGYEIDHLCKNPLCVNPRHLEPVLPIVNNMRSGSPASVRAKATHCQHGHEWTAKNTYWRVNRNNRVSRMCRECRRLGMRRGGKWGPDSTSPLGPEVVPDPPGNPV